MKAFKGLLYSDKRPSALLLKAITKPSVERKERIVTCYHSRGIAIRRLYLRDPLIFGVSNNSKCAAN